MYKYKILCDRINLACILFLSFILLDCSNRDNTVHYKSFSGIYPHLAYYNNENECGTGAVVPWADRLWMITYGPHLPFGSSDKLYEVTNDLQRIVREESIGGTPANRMIQSGQQAGIINQLYWEEVEGSGVFSGFRKPVTVMTGRMAGIPNGRGSETSGQPKIPIT